MTTLTPIVSHHGAKATQQAAARLPQLYKSRLPRNLALAASTRQVLPLRKPYGKSLPGFLNSTAVVVHNDNDDPNPTQPITKLSPTLAENKIVSPSLTPFCDDAACSDYMSQLAEAIAALDWLQRRSITDHGQRTAVPSDATRPFAPPSPTNKTNESPQLHTTPLCNDTACFLTTNRKSPQQSQLLIGCNGRR